MALFRIIFGSLAHATVLTAAVAQEPHACEMLEAPAAAGADVRAGFLSDRLWPGGIVPYQYDANVTPENRGRMAAAFADLESWVGIRFVPRDGSEPFWITIRSTTGSNSATVGRAAGGVVNIRSWEAPGFLVHELMHTLGFVHEQQRSDRDQFVTVRFDLVGAGNGNVTRVTHDDLVNAGPYDFDSVTRYPLTFESGGQPNLIPLQPYFDEYQSTMGDWAFDDDGLSNDDIWGLHLAYGGNPTPGPFDYELPQDGVVARAGDPVNMSWQPAPFAERYRVEVSRIRVFRFNTVTETINGTARTVPALPAGRYNWRVTAINERGERRPGPRPFDIRVIDVIETCDADIAAAFGVLEINDVMAFAEAFAADGPSADLFPPGAPEGTRNINGVLAFAAAFNGPCTAGLATD